MSHSLYLEDPTASQNISPLVHIHPSSPLRWPKMTHDRYARPQTNIVYQNSTKSLYHLLLLYRRPCARFPMVSHPSLLAPIKKSYSDHSRVSPNLTAPLHTNRNIFLPTSLPSYHLMCLRYRDVREGLCLTFFPFLFQFAFLFLVHIFSSRILITIHHI